MTWRLIDEDSTDVYLNLALDEAIARVTAAQENKSNSIRFWRSKRAVVIGRFQCVHKETNLSFCRENSISIARRFTGGGAVYHDSGNLNFSICTDRSEEYIPRSLKEIYELFIGGVADALQTLHIPARYDPESSCIRINDMKITGTAGWLKRGVAFLHGTLLINCDLSMLRRSLSPPKGQPIFLRDRTRIRCMDSRRDIVTNIIDQMKDCPTNYAIKDAIITGIEKMSGNPVKPGEVSGEERDTAQALYQSRYSKSEWNLGTPAR